ncbi:MAG: AraC family transcriptional regulator ligand-binding domain-containing protein [Alphaproteobacteria bacterium]
MPATYARIVSRHWADDESLSLELATPPDGSVAISVDEQLSQAKVLARRLSAGWGLQLGRLFDAAAHGPVGVAALSAPSLSEALHVIAAHGSLRTPFIRFDIVEQGDHAGLSLAPVGSLSSSDARPLLEATLVGAQTLLRQILQRTLGQTRVLVSWPRPGYAMMYDTIFEGSVTFDATLSAFLVPAHWFAEQSPFADAASHAAAMQQLKRLPGSQASPPTMVQAVQRILGSSNGTWSLKRVARELSVGPRTLERHLAAEGAGFGQLADERRKTVASELLCDTRLSIDEIAFRLGYADRSNFGRACRRWFGVAPATFRAEKR